MKYNFNIQFFGGGSWDEAKFCTYAASKGRSYDTATKMSTGQNMFTERRLHESLNPYGVVRECCDSEEHPNTVPVILALDVTGSMGSACKRTATALGAIMSDLYKSHNDIEFMMMAIGDLAYDEAPIQASQFESDTRIAEALDNIYFEGGGGGNKFESYTAAWYFGLKHTKLDCWKRSKKGIIITMRDEPLNPYLPRVRLSNCLGDSLQGDVETNTLYEETLNKFHIFHIGVDDSANCFENYREEIESSFGQLLGGDFKISNLNSLPSVITNCIDESAMSQSGTFMTGKAFITPVTVDTESHPEEETKTTQINPDTGAIRW